MLDRWVRYTGQDVTRITRRTCFAALRKPARVPLQAKLQQAAAVTETRAGPAPALPQTMHDVTEVLTLGSRHFNSRVHQFASAFEFGLEPKDRRIPQLPQLAHVCKEVIGEGGFGKVFKVSGRVLCASLSEEAIAVKVQFLTRALCMILHLHMVRCCARMCVGMCVQQISVTMCR